MRTCEKFICTRHERNPTKVGLREGKCFESLEMFQATL